MTIALAFTGNQEQDSGGEDFAAFPARGVGLDVVLDNIAEGITAQRPDGSFAGEVSATLDGLVALRRLAGLEIRKC